MPDEYKAYNNAVEHREFSVLQPLLITTNYYQWLRMFYKLTYHTA